MTILRQWYRQKCSQVSKVFWQLLNTLIESIQVTHSFTSGSWVFSSLTRVKFILCQVTQSRKYCPNYFKDNKSENLFMKYQSEMQPKICTCTCVYFYVHQRAGESYFWARADWESDVSMLSEIQSSEPQFFLQPWPKQTAWGTEKEFNLCPLSRDLHY